MEKIRIKKIKKFSNLILIISFFVFSCSSGFLNIKNKEIFKNEEFEKKVSIKTVDVPAPEISAEPIKEPLKETLKESTNDNKLEKILNVDLAKTNQNNINETVSGIQLPKPKSSDLKSKKNNKKKNEILYGSSNSLNIETKRQPDLENADGFNGQRRPVIDPFRVGEKIIHTVSYFGTPAGQLILSVNPMVEVNGRKSYNFMTQIKSSRLFSQFYSVDDSVETFVDFEKLIPHVFKLHIKESGQLKEAQSFFDHEKNVADYWENKYTQKNGHEDKKLHWQIAPFSQNAFSAIFYMRVFKWEIGKDYAFQVSDDEKNVLFKGKALNKEKIKTDAGEFNAIKLKAEVASRGALSQTGDLYFWVSDDDRKFILKIEAKIKIGTLVSEISEIVGR